ncbi:DUF2130 domain-containing protein [Leadbetterella sp. DM7]|uniref:DUF2130 domain-containing protein n=1 Tax=Leadbetterella sp. DM7 TaxID=3235085 RepID=UPI00349EFEC3
MSINTTTCPNCGHKFDAGEAMQKHLEIELKKNMELREKEYALRMDEFKKRLETEKKEFEISEKKKLWAVALSEAQKRMEEKNAAELTALKQDNEAKQKEILKSREKEIELLRREQELKSQQELMQIQIQKELIEKTAQIEEAAKKKKDEEFELTRKEFEKKLEDQKNLINEMKRKAEQGSTQLQGEIQELALEEILRRAFVYDTVEEVSKGIRGADAIQTVINEFGQICGKIVFESKRTQNWQDAWIDKLKDDQRALGAEIAVLVSQVMPKDMERFGQREGIWICNYQEVISLVFVLRQILVRSQSARAVQENKTDKMGLLYNYLTGTQFRQQLEAIVEGFSSMKTELEREKRAMKKIWKEREVQIEKVIDNTIDMYGSIKGIAGNAIAPIQPLELEAGETGEETE